MWYNCKKFKMSIELQFLKTYVASFKKKKKTHVVNEKKKECNKVVSFYAIN